MIADAIARRVEQYALGASTDGRSYRADVWARADGTHRVVIVVLDPISAWKPGDHQRWTERYACEAPDLETARTARGDIVERLRGQECLACGSPLLNEEIREHRGIYCYSCGDAAREGRAK